MLKRRLSCLIALILLLSATSGLMGCEEWHGEYEAYEEEPFDFSEHMRIDGFLVELMERDLSEFEMMDLVERGRVSIWVRDFENVNEVVVEERRIRIEGGVSWEPSSYSSFGARLNGEIIPFGDPFMYDFLKYGIGIPLFQIGGLPFFVEINLIEGQNTVEFILGTASDEFPAPIDRLMIRTIYIYYKPLGE